MIDHYNLHQTIRALAGRVRFQKAYCSYHWRPRHWALSMPEFRDEGTTRKYFIDPLLDPSFFRSPFEIRQEYHYKDIRADYFLGFLWGRIVIEAKRPGNDLLSRTHGLPVRRRYYWSDGVYQVLRYCEVLRARVGILTDGLRWYAFDIHGRVRANFNIENVGVSSSDYLHFWERIESV